MKNALGMIVRNLNSAEEVLRFVDNAERYGHKLECVILAYNRRPDAQVLGEIKKRIPIYAIDINNPEYCYAEFRRRGLSSAAVKALLECPVDTRHGLVPYGFNRNLVTVEAVLRSVETLFFVDNDIHPSTIKQSPNGYVTEEIDFFSAHLEHLRSGSLITTGEYSGYSILPPAVFDGMDDLLHGLCKSDMVDYWQSSREHSCIIVQPPVREPKPCTKILGGNSAITLSAFLSLPPFFSSSYMAEGELFLGRGEDTVLGMGALKSGTACTDIELFPFHDTYDDYPNAPDLQCDPKIQERFYFACTGWVGRNPFLSYLSGEDTKSAREFQRERLEPGLRALALYTSNPRFLNVLRNFDISWGSIGRYVGEYELLLEAWREFIEGSDN